MKTTAYYLLCLLMLLLLSVYTCLSAKAQDGDTNPTNIYNHTDLSIGFMTTPSPDAGAMIKYGKADVNPYTGTVGLSIPVFTYTDADFNIPISIDYASSGYKPNLTTGAVGMGWYLNVGGSITREVCGICDETKGTSQDLYSFSDKYVGHAVYVEPGAEVFGCGHMYSNPEFNIDLLNYDCVLSGQANSEYLFVKTDTSRPLYEHTITPKYEVEPDIFHFNFMGYTGQFILLPRKQYCIYNTNHPVGEFTLDVELSSAGFTSFTITTGDGNQYIFSQIDRTQTIVENDSDDNVFVDSCWKLTQITAPNQRVVKFNYGVPYYYEACLPINVDDRNTITYMYDNIEDPDWTGKSKIFHYQKYNTYSNTKTVVNNPISITVGDDDDDDNNDKAIAKFEYIDKYGNITTSTLCDDDYRKLSKINIYNPQDSLIRSCKLSYEHRFSSDTLPTKTSALTFLDKVTIPGIGTYSMTYNNNVEFPTTKTFGIDWYGYYNPNISDFMPAIETVKADSLIVAKMRESDSVTMQYGMLTKIGYPTGGHTTFEYEANRFGCDQSGYNYIGDSLTAGVRVKRISNYRADNTLSNVRSFAYVNSDGSNSGTLLWRPMIYSEYQVRVDDVRISKREILSSYFDFPYSGRNHIEYCRVLETTSSASDSDTRMITEYQYYSARYAEAMDKILDHTSSFNIENNLYYGIPWEYRCLSIYNNALSSLDRLIKIYETWRQSRFGGILSSKTFYSNDTNHPTYKEQYTFAPNYYYHSQSPATIEVPTISLNFKCTHLYDLCTPQLQQVQQTTYGQSGDVIFQTGYTITRDTLGRTASVVRIDSKGDTICDRYKYFKAIPSYLSEHISYRNNQITDGTKYEFTSTQYPYLFLPAAVKKADILPNVNADSLLYHTEYTYNYNQQRRPLQITDKNGKITSLVWGHNGLQPIAMVENMEYEEFMSQYGGYVDNYPYGLPTSLENSYHSIEGPYAITTYRYNPFVGLLHVFDASNRKIYYQYDKNGRLRLVKDDKAIPIQKFNYNIVTDK